MVDVADAVTENAIAGDFDDAVGPPAAVSAPADASWTEAEAALEPVVRPV